MDRVRRGGYSAAIGAAYELIPTSLHGRLQPHFLTGSDPVFAGLHGYRDISDGRSYRNTAHCCYPYHQLGISKALRRTTIVMPKVVGPITIVHELGHVLDESLRFEVLAEPVTAYAAGNRYEAFAEAFTSWLVPGYADAPDRSILALLEGLAA
jgi:hypothetical protein